MEITARDIGRLIELNKKKAELEFKRTIYGEESSESVLVNKNATVLTEKTRNAGIEIVYPNQRKLDALAKVLSGFTKDEIREAIKTKKGKAYEILKERGIIVKRNYENRFEIAKLFMIAAKMKDDEKRAFLDVLAAGCLAKALKIESLDENTKKKLTRIMKRCGIGLAEFEKEFMPAHHDEPEVRVEISNRYIWVEQATLVRIQENLNKISSINSKIQLKNAERQIRTFGEEEEGYFNNLQQEYLFLLKEQDELLKGYWDEEKISVMV
ncbi:MAG: hypothetical protein ABID61_00305 [Candidatus Micrarchaeota archaeon]